METSAGRLFQIINPQLIFALKLLDEKNITWYKIGRRVAVAMPAVQNDSSGMKVTGELVVQAPVVGVG